MASGKTVFGKETFQFFRELAKNNHKPWMDENRERYKSVIVQPFRKLLEDLAPAVLRIDPGFDTSGRTGANFSRINRDIRFAKDKTPYKSQMYLKFQRPSPGDRETGQLYVGLSKYVVTAGFRVYSGPKRRESSIAMVAEPRVLANPKWVARQKKRLSKKYESYWYTAVKGEWTKREGWPVDPADWKRLQAWIVRKKLSPAAAGRVDFCGGLVKSFRELYPLVKFTSIP